MLPLSDAIAFLLLGAAFGWWFKRRPSQNGGAAAVFACGIFAVLALRLVLAELFEAVDVSVMLDVGDVSMCVAAFVGLALFGISKRAPSARRWGLLLAWSILAAVVTSVLLR